MRWGKRWGTLRKLLFSRRQLETDLTDEIQFHIEGRVDALVAQGMDEAEARRRARADFGDIPKIRSEMGRLSLSRHRRERREQFLSGLVRDLADSLRELRRNPGFAAVAVLTLALGIGANTAMFSVLHGVVLRPLPYAEPERLVAVWPAMNFNMSLVDEIQDRTSSLAEVAGISYWGLTLTGDGPPESLDASVVSTNYFDVLGVAPFLGRGFRPEERNPDRSDVAILSHGFWERRFGGDRSVIGRRIRLEGYGKESREIVGIAPPGFQSPDRRVQVWIPLHLAPGHTVATDSTWYVNQVVGRLAAQADVETASQEVAQVARAIQDDFPQRILEDPVRQAGVTPLLEEVLGEAGHLLWVLLAAVGLVLLMACANLANLLLARAARKGQDAAIRTALGASRGRLVRQHLTAAGILALLGAVIGVVLARITLAVLVAGLGATGIPRAGDVGLSPMVLAFTAAIAMAAALAFGLLPALRLGRAGLRRAMEGGGRGNATDRGGHRLNRGLVAAETALAVVLVVGAGLMLRTVGHLYSIDPGFDPDGVVAVQLAPSGARYQNQGELSRAFLGRVEEGIRDIPGVETVGSIHLLPLTSNNWSFPYLAQDHEPPENAPLPSANFRIVTPGYFETMGIPVVRGRSLTPADGPDDLPVGLVNEAMAELLWPGEDPLGKEILLFGNQPFQVVGVVGDVRQHGLDRDALPEMYRPFRQYSWPGVTVMVKAPRRGVSVLAPKIREVVWEVDPEVPVPTVQSLDRVFSHSLARPRLFAELMAAFGLLALVLGVVGIYGVMSYVVGARRREFGVRVALGASPAKLQEEAMAMGMVPVMVGLVVGTGIAYLAAPLLDRFLFGVEPADLSTFVLVVGTLGGTGALASWLPARRASKVDPVEVLSPE